jgi:hypothetical protein
MKRYCIKCRAGKIEFFDIITEDDEGYRIRLTRLSDGNEKIFEESMPRHLFDICVKTGYIFEMENAPERARTVA